MKNAKELTGLQAGLNDIFAKVGYNLEIEQYYKKYTKKSKRPKKLIVKHRRGYCSTYNSLEPKTFCKIVEMEGKTRRIIGGNDISTLKVAIMNGKDKIRIDRLDARIATLTKQKNELLDEAYNKGKRLDAKTFDKMKVTAERTFARWLKLCRIKDYESGS